MSAALVKRLADAGLDAHAIVAAMEAFEAVEEERKAAKREGNRERQARRRGKETDASRVTERDNDESRVTACDAPLPLPPSPQTPQPPTPTPGEQSRARKGRARAEPEHPSLEPIWQAANQTSRDRSGRPATSDAIRHAIEAGATVEAIQASVAQHCRATGDHAKGLHRIIAAQLWRDHMARPPDPQGGADPRVLAGRQAHYAKTGHWSPDWGARPSPSPANDTPAQDAA